MDRLTRTLTGLTLALVATTAGCHNTREKVPPHSVFHNDGKTPATAASNPVEFSTKPHDPPATATGMIGGAPGNIAQTNSPLSSTNSAGNAYVNSNGNKYGGIGTAGLGAPPAMGPAANPAYPPQPAARNDVSSNPIGQNPDAPSPY